MDTSKLKVGDVVHVRCSVEIVNEHGNAFVRAAPPQSGMRGWISPNAVAHVEPRPIQPGDKVRTKARLRAEVLGIAENDDGRLAWLKYCDGGYATYPVANLEHADA